MTSRGNDPATSLCSVTDRPGDARLRIDPLPMTAGGGSVRRPRMVSFTPRRQPPRCDDPITIVPACRGDDPVTIASTADPNVRRCIGFTGFIHPPQVIPAMRRRIASLAAHTHTRTHTHTHTHTHNAGPLPLALSAARGRAGPPGSIPWAALRPVRRVRAKARKPPCVIKMRNSRKDIFYHAHGPGCIRFGGVRANAHKPPAGRPLLARGRGSAVARSVLAKTARARAPARLSLRVRACV